jgi:hypothetical protein
MKCLLRNSLFRQFARAKVRLLVPVLFGTVAYSCSDRPPLRVVNSGERITLDVQTLGEYQTTAGRIRLTEINTRKVVWELRTESGTPHIHTIELHA